MHTHARNPLHRLCADAAERLLTLLGVDEEESEESPVSSSSSSEDEGVELDGELEDEEEERVDGRLLHQLAASLANELKQSRERQRAATTTAARPGDREPRRMEVIVAGTNRADHSCLQDRSFEGGASDCRDVASKWGRRRDGECSFGKRRRRRPVSDEPRRRRPDGRSWLGQGGGEGLVRTGQVLASSWSAGWDACATEALRYLVEDEGLPPHHPTVLAMKDHLEVQRERAFLRYAA